MRDEREHRDDLAPCRRGRGRTPTASCARPAPGRSAARPSRGPVVVAVADVVDDARRRCGYACAQALLRLLVVAEQLLDPVPPLLQAVQRQPQLGDAVADHVVGLVPAERHQQAPGPVAAGGARPRARPARPASRASALVDLDREHLARLGEAGRSSRRAAAGRRRSRPGGRRSARSRRAGARRPRWRCRTRRRSGRSARASRRARPGRGRWSARRAAAAAGRRPAPGPA